MNTPDSPNSPAAPRQEPPQDGWRDICWSSARQIAAMYPVPSGQYEDRLQELAMIVSMAISRSKQLDAPPPAARHIPIVRPSDANKTERSSKIVTDSLGFRLEVEISFEEIAGSGIHKTYEREGAVTEDCLHKIMINRSLFGPEIAEVIAHEVYHLFYSVRPLIKADEETEATVFGQLVGRIHCLAAPAHDCNHGQIPDVSILIAQLEAFHRDSVAHHSAQLQQLGGRIKELEGALGQAELALMDCANQFKGHHMIASYDVALAYAYDAHKALLRPAQEQATKQP